MKLIFEKVKPDPFFQPNSAESENDFTKNWNSWTWQLQNSIKAKEDFIKIFDLLANDLEVFNNLEKIFKAQATPYYLSLSKIADSVKKTLLPSIQELSPEIQSQFDPLGERKNNPTNRVIHRYSDRVLFLVTDNCSVYCRYCTRKHFTGNEQSFIKEKEFEEAIKYIEAKPGVREVILSGGDPLTLSDSLIEKVLSRLRKIEHIEIIRIGTRMPVVCPMRVTDDLVLILKKHKPVFLMTHFNHPKEVTHEAKTALEKFVDHGVPVFNQMVLLNGINNHPAIVQALSRRLLYCRVKPYYMFQADPSIGTDYLRTSIDESENIQKELWGHISGLAMPNLSLDIPSGGGKVGITPNFEVARNHEGRTYKGWDGVEEVYKNPSVLQKLMPKDLEDYVLEWNSLKESRK